MDFEDLISVVVVGLLVISALIDLWRKRVSLRSNLMVGLCFAISFLLQFLAVGLTWQNTLGLIATLFWFIYCAKSASTFKNTLNSSHKEQ